jgi:hypothetical protein
MLILGSVNDRLLLTLAPGTGPFDVHTTWVDTKTSDGSITPGRANTALSASGQVSIAGTPPASTFRNVKTVHIRNKSATVGPQILLHHNDGANQELLFDLVVPAGKQIQYTDQGGFQLL